MLNSTSTVRAAGIGATVLALTALTADTALAWHPKGTITKGVTNVTAGGTTISAADTTDDAVIAKPGDTLKYTIVIKNDSPTANSYDDLGFTKLTDTLPAGLELVNGQLTDNLGTVKAQQSVTRTITVKVKSDVKDGDILDNKACFSGEATNKEHGTQQTGCDHAFVKVTVPAPTPTPDQGGGEVKGTEAPSVLPETGTANLLGSLVGLGAMTSAAVAYHRSRQTQR